MNPNTTSAPIGWRFTSAARPVVVSFTASTAPSAGLDIRKISEVVGESNGHSEPFAPVHPVTFGARRWRGPCRLHLAHDEFRRHNVHVSVPPAPAALVQDKFPRHKRLDGVDGS